MSKIVINGYQFLTAWRCISQRWLFDKSISKFELFQFPLFIPMKCCILSDLKLKGRSRISIRGWSCTLIGWLQGSWFYVRDWCWGSKEPTSSGKGGDESASFPLKRIQYLTMMVLLLWILFDIQENCILFPYQISPIASLPLENLVISQLLLIPQGFM